MADDELFELWQHREALQADWLEKVKRSQDTEGLDARQRFEAALARDRALEKYMKVDSIWNKAMKQRAAS